MLRTAFFLAAILLLAACDRKSNPSSVAGIWKIDKITDSLQRTIVDRSKYDSMFAQTFAEIKFSFQVQEKEFTAEDSLKAVADIETMWRMVFGKTYEFTANGKYIIGNPQEESNAMRYDSLNFSITEDELTMDNKSDKMTWKYRILPEGGLHLTDDKTNINTFLSRTAR